MSQNSPADGEVGTSAIEIEAVTAQAGQTFPLSARVVCTPPCDREGERLHVLDEDEETVCILTLGAYDGEGGNVSDSVEVVAPLETGTFNWRVVVPQCTAGDVRFEEAFADCPVHVEAHRVDLVVWDVPKTIVAGELMRVKIGAKCSAGCIPAGWMLNVTQGEEPPLRITLGETVWPQSKGLYYTEVELTAPQEIGRQRWHVSFEKIEEEAPHVAAETAFGVHCTPRPECTLEVQVYDLATREPVTNATVQLHPYRVHTDEQGVARIAVHKGSYRLLVSGTRHFPHSAELDVNQDAVERVELEIDRELTEADIW